jgi:HEAT repeat associated with sister chromatid cohesion
MSRKYLVGLFLLVLGGLGALAWLEQTTLLAWFHVHMLCSATDANRQARAARVAELGEIVVPGLLDALQRPDANVCLNAREGLDALVRKWGGLVEPRTTDLTIRLAKEFPQLSHAGQRELLELAAGWFQARPQPLPAPGLILASGRLLAAASSSTDAEVQTAGLELCAVLASSPQGAEILSGGRELVRTYLQSNTAGVRIRAIQVGLQQGMDLLESVANLLTDSSAEVRRAALVAVGPADKVVMDETLLPCLRDPDAEVQRLCEVALRARGLGPEHLKLARLLTDPRACERIKVLEDLQTAKDLDPSIWLRRLSHDPSPMVRAATIRLMSMQTTIDLTDRIDQMAHSDPSPSVCYIAAVFLKDARARQMEQSRP